MPETPSYEQLLAENGELRALVGELRRANHALTERVSLLEARVGKNSRNSSKPPSSDGYAKPAPRSLRRASGRRAGKQAGQPGASLEGVADPDVVITHVPQACQGCGDPLEGAAVVGVQVR